MKRYELDEENEENEVRKKFNRMILFGAVGGGGVVAVLIVVVCLFAGRGGKRSDETTESRTEQNTGTTRPALIVSAVALDAAFKENAAAANARYSQQSIRIVGRVWRVDDDVVGQKGSYRLFFDGSNRFMPGPSCVFPSSAGVIDLKAEKWAVVDVNGREANGHHDWKKPRIIASGFKSEAEAMEAAKK